MFRKDVDSNELIYYIESSRSFKKEDESEIGTIIVSKETIWKDVRHGKVHLIKLKMNPNNIRPDIHYLFAIVPCYDSIGLLISGFNR